MFVGVFLAGVGLQRLARLTFPPVHAMRLIGFGLIGGAIMLALSSVGAFVVARTTIVPFSTASKLVTWGPFRFTRNPMYVSLVLAYLGFAAIYYQLLALVLLVVPILFLSTIVIPFEEGRMREVFGDTYVQYCARVRRWL